MCTSGWEFGNAGNQPTDAVRLPLLGDEMPSHPRESSAAKPPQLAIGKIRATRVNWVKSTVESATLIAAADKPFCVSTV
jgi:hypothetical protein